MINSVLKVINGIIKIRGATDGTLIGNISDALKVTHAPTVTATLTSVSASTSSVSLLGSNSARKGVLFFNDSNATCFIAFSATATTSAFTRKLPAGDFWDRALPSYSGAISGIWTVANGSMRITELT